MFWVRQQNYPHQPTMPVNTGWREEGKLLWQPQQPLVTYKFTVRVQIHYCVVCGLDTLWQIQSNQDGLLPNFGQTADLMTKTAA